MQKQIPIKRYRMGEGKRFNKIYLEQTAKHVIKNAAQYKPTAERLPGDQHKAYLQSFGWKHIRQQVLERAEGRCEKCGGQFAHHIHHLHYDRLGNESPLDLLAVCAPCHAKIHNLNL